VPFTVWSKDRLIGESELSYVANTDKFKMGDFVATEHGEKLMPIITGVRRAVVEMSRSIRSRNTSDADAEITAIEDTEEWADVAEATAHFEGLELQLRGPDGSAIPTESIDIIDTEYTLATFGQPEETWETELDDGLEKDPVLMDEDERRLLAAIEHDAAILDEHFAAIEAEGPPEFEGESVFPRYQIQVQLP
jgi:hypothetical protein